jgi:hypothetical protein
MGAFKKRRIKKIQDGESEKRAEGEDRREGEKKDQRQVEEVKLLFRWELSDEPLPSIKDFRYWAC